MFRFYIFMVPVISQIKEILTQYQPKGNVFQVNAQHWNSPRMMWRSPKHPHGWRGEMRTRKAERNKLQNKIQRTNLEARAKQKIRIEQLSTAAAKITCKQDEKGIQEGTRLERKGRKGE